MSIAEYNFSYGQVYISDHAWAFYNDCRLHSVNLICPDIHGGKRWSLTVFERLTNLESTFWRWPHCSPLHLCKIWIGHWAEPFAFGDTAWHPHDKWGTWIRSPSLPPAWAILQEPVKRTHAQVRAPCLLIWLLYLLEDNTTWVCSHKLPKNTIWDVPLFVMPQHTSLVKYLLFSCSNYFVNFSKKLFNITRFPRLFLCLFLCFPEDLSV